MKYIQVLIISARPEVLRMSLRESPREYPVVVLDDVRSPPRDLIEKISTEDIRVKDIGPIERAPKPVQAFGGRKAERARSRHAMQMARRRGY